jgi:periplasmic copper chaperone A
MNRFHAAAVVGLLVSQLLSSLPAQADEPYKVGSIEIDQPWARATPPTARTGAAYFVLHNTGTSEDRLVGIRSSAADRADVHRMSMNGDIMTMSEVNGGLAIPAGGSVALQPSGYHVMLTGLKHALMQGSEIPLTLTFANAGSVEIHVEVEAIGAPGPTPPAKEDGTMKGMNMNGMKM